MNFPPRIPRAAGCQSLITSLSLARLDPAAPWSPSNRSSWKQSGRPSETGRSRLPESRGQLGHENESITKKHYIVKPAVAPDSSHILEMLAPKNAKHDPGKPQAA
jgi:hypothetical protein